MRISSFQAEPFYTTQYRVALTGGGVAERLLPYQRAAVDGLPESLEALIAMSDLQGLVASHDEPDRQHLLGDWVVDELELLADVGELPSPSSCGVLLMGDLFARLDRRGGRGDVRAIWRRLANRFRWVAGVAGNHDHFGDAAELRGFRAEERIHLLDDEVVELDGLQIAGLGGIIGSPGRPFRRSREEFAAAVRRLASRTDLLLLHEGPDDPIMARPGSSEVREALGDRDVTVFCGHRHWEIPVAECDAAQVVNVDARVVVLSHR